MASAGRGEINRWGDRRRLRVGLLGGSFNPAHDGHRYVALTALKRLGLDQVWLLVSPQNPLKPVAGMAPFADRLAGADRMCGRHPHLRACGVETAWGTQRTADTLALFVRSFPRIRFVWLMGADNLMQIHRWSRWRRIFGTVPVAVIDRGPYSFRSLAAKAARRMAGARITRERELADHPPPAWVFLAVRRHPASASALRNF